MSVIFLYDDEHYHLLPPDEILPETVIERHDEEIKGKQRNKKLLEPGMKVRLFWNHKFNKSKATVHAVGSFHDLDLQFKQLNATLKAKVRLRRPRYK